MLLIKLDMNNFEPKENKELKDFNENDNVGIHFNTIHEEIVETVAFAIVCITKDHTPYPQNAKYIPNNPEKRAEKKEILACVLKSIKMVSFTL